MTLSGRIYRFNRPSCARQTGYTIIGEFTIQLVECIPITKRVRRDSMVSVMRENIASLAEKINMLVPTTYTSNTRR